jgi:hypothetical protein
VTAPIDVEALGLDRERLRARAEFFRTYAALAHTPAWPDPPEPAALVARLAGVPRDPGVEMIALEDFEGHGDAVAPAGALPERPEEAADARRQAGICLLPTDPAAAQEELLAAADLYSSLGLPFGLFLSSVCSSWSAPAQDAMTLLHEYPPPEPAQQVQLLLAAAGHPDVSSSYPDQFDALSRRPPASDWATIGPGGQPLARWWRFGLDLADVSRMASEPPVAQADARDRLGETLAAAARAHGAVLRDLARDTYHWEEAHLRVDLVDLFVAGATCLLLRLDPSWRRDPRLAALDPYEALSVAAGAGLAALM